MRVAALFLLATLLGAQDAIAPSPKVLETFAGAQAMDNTIQEAVRADELPGAVVIVGRRNGIVYQKAYGNRSVVPTREPMTLDTIFDIASLTKVVATTTSIAKLVEQGKVRINDPVTKYLPEFQAGRSDITVRQLLTHTSGMRPDVDLKPEWSGYETGIRLALLDKPIAPPNTRYMYSDINFVLLGEIVRRASGKSLPEFAKENIFDPLGMRDTGFQPSPTLRQRIAPTEILPGANEPLRGVVHDPTCRFMGGVAGHAGLFSTAYDLSRFAEMMLGLGERKGVRVLSPLTVRAFTSPQSPQEITAVRGFGWDINSPNSGNRGDLFPIGSYGHTGFTGTSMWIDPATQTYVILLANSVHPHGRLPITPLRGRVANVAAAGLGLDVPLGQDVDYAPTPATAVQPVKTSAPLPPVQLGIDVLAAQNFATLRGKRVALITNHTGVTSDGKRTIDVMLKGGVNLVSLLSPEHGISGTEDHENVGHAKDPVTGLRVWSLYNGPNRRPSDEMLSGVDVLVFDIQDIGARFYTYICTMRNAMEVAAQRNLEFIVLDRPNPINGEVVEGPVLDTEYASFVGCGNLPLRHGMTVGELASLFASEITPAPKLSVVRMNNWQRSLWFDQTGLTWVNPSPNMRSLTAALLYPGLGMLEYWKDYSVGRGTDAPFEQIGADWIDGRKLAAQLNARGIPGVRVYPTTFAPATSNFAGKTIEGIRFLITDRDSFRSARLGTELALALARMRSTELDWKLNAKLIGNSIYLQDLGSRTIEAQQLEQKTRAGLEQFLVRRAKYLLY